MKEERTINPVPDNIVNQAGVVRYLRDSPPVHYSIKIESFSRLVDLGDENYESAMFDASGYTWRLVLYPNGNSKRGGEGHISLYLAIDNTDSLPLGWEAYVTYKMFVFNHNRDQYLTIQDDAAHQIRRFHQAKKECGFDRLISLDTLNDAANGYLIDDSCVFGVEVYEVQYTGNGEALKMIEDPEEVTFDWKICRFSTISDKTLRSVEFEVGRHKWRLLFYPNGCSSKDWISLFLELADDGLSTGTKVLADYSLLIKNQISDCHAERSGSKWFIPNDLKSAWGWINFELLCDLEQESNGFKQKDTILIQTKVTVKAEVTNFYSESSI